VGQLNVKFYQGSSGAFRSTTDYLDSLLAKYGNKVRPGRPPLSTPFPKQRTHDAHPPRL
jgi:hypothetical protein